MSEILISDYNFSNSTPISLNYNGTLYYISINNSTDFTVLNLYINNNYLHNNNIPICYFNQNDNLLIFNNDNSIMWGNNIDLNDIHKLPNKFIFYSDPNNTSNIKMRYSDNFNITYLCSHANKFKFYLFAKY
jgi:hypothetical protein